MLRSSVWAVLALLVALCVVAVPACKKDEAETTAVNVRPPAGKTAGTEATPEEGTATEAVAAAGEPVDVTNAQAVLDKVIATYSDIESFHSKETLDMSMQMMGMDINIPASIETRFIRPNKLRVATSVEMMGMKTTNEICNDGTSAYVAQSNPMLGDMVFKMPAPADAGEVLTAGAAQSGSGSSSSPISELALALGQIGPDCIDEQRLTVDTGAAGDGPPVAPEGVLVVPVSPMPRLNADLFISPETYRLVGYYADLGPEFFKAAMDMASDQTPELEGMMAMAQAATQNMTATYTSTIDHVSDTVAEADLEYTPPAGVEVQEVSDPGEMVKAIMEKTQAMVGNMGGMGGAGGMGGGMGGAPKGAPSKVMKMKAAPGGG